MAESEDPRSGTASGPEGAGDASDDGDEGAAGGTAPSDAEDGGEAEAAAGPAAEAEAGDEDGGGSGAEGDDLSAEIQEELAELDELRDRHLRLAAEFENFRKRTRREMRAARERAQAELAGRLLDALDDLERVAETSTDATSVEALQEGVEMVHRKLRKELGEAGLSKIEVEGDRFDPEMHEALLTTPVDDPDEDDRVSRVLINGYTFGDRVLRPARVEVKKYAGPDADGEDGSPDGDGNG